MSGLTVLPAIDLKDGKCVRLRQGDPDQRTVYSEDPVAMARQWADAGAEWLHVVDLDGAFSGRPVHTGVISRIRSAIGIPIEVGGGVRTLADARVLLEAGVTRVVMGTRALEDAAALQAIAAELGDALAVGIDARNGFVQVRGWRETSAVRATDLARRVEADGVRTVIYTDTATDGMLGGVNTCAVAEICGVVSCNVIASGGVASMADIVALRGIGAANLAGVIVGKALYEGTVALADLLAAARADLPGRACGIPAHFCGGRCSCRRSSSSSVPGSVSCSRWTRHSRLDAARSVSGYGVQHGWPKWAPRSPSPAGSRVLGAQCLPSGPSLSSRVVRRAPSGVKRLRCVPGCRRAWGC